MCQAYIRLSCRHCGVWMRMTVFLSYRLAFCCTIFTRSRCAGVSRYLRFHPTYHFVIWIISKRRFYFDQSAIKLYIFNNPKTYNTVMSILCSDRFGWTDTWRTFTSPGVELVPVSDDASALARHLPAAHKHGGDAMWWVVVHGDIVWDLGLSVPRAQCMVLLKYWSFTENVITWDSFGLKKGTARYNCHFLRNQEAEL